VGWGWEDGGGGGCGDQSSIIAAWYVSYRAGGGVKLLASEV